MDIEKDLIKSRKNLHGKNINDIMFEIFDIFINDLMVMDRKELWNDKILLWIYSNYWPWSFFY